MSDRRFHIAAVCFLAALTAGLYAQTLDDEWHLDDLGQLTPTVREHSPRVAPEHYRGISVLWLWTWDYAAAGEDPARYHVTNTAIHFATAASLYWLLWMLLPVGRSRRLGALAGASIFCVHPLATQSVAYLTQRSTSVAALLFLDSVSAWVVFRRVPGSRRLFWLVLSLVAFALGLHAKHVVVLVPVALAATEVLWIRPGRRRALLWLLPYVLLSAGRLIDFAPRIEGGWRNDEAGAAPRYSRWEYSISQPRSVATYLGLFFVPRDQNLDWDLQPVRSIPSTSFLLPAALLAALAAGAWHTRRSSPATTFGVSLFLLALIPTSSLITSADLLFEHRAYLPMAGLCIAIAPWVARVHARHALLAWASAAFAIALLAVVSTRRLAVWDTELSLWSDVVAKSPGKARPHANLALALQNAGRFEEAERHLRRALELRPEFPPALNNLGNVLRARGRSVEAESAFLRALEIRPAYVGPRMNLGNMELARGNIRAAEAWYREAIRVQPKAAEARYNLAKVLERQRRWTEAIAEYERVVAERPRETLYLNDLGCARLQAGDTAGAERDLRAVVARRPDWEVPWYNLGIVLDATGRRDEARRAYERALAAAPDLAPARERLGR